jgi:hypothetical protein
MTELRELRIAIYNVNWSPAPESDLLEPLLSVKVQRGAFVVELRSVEGENVRSGDIFPGHIDVPFSIQRRP